MEPMDEQPTFDNNTFELDAALHTILQHEGGFVDDKNDPGGATNFGISLRYLQGLVADNPSLLHTYDYNHNGVIDAEDIKNLSCDKAMQIYKTQWWDKNQYGLIHNMPLAIKVFDLAVNLGAIRANKFLQEACSEITKTTNFVIDGIIGEYTLKLVNACNAQTLLSALQSIAKSYYIGLVNEHPQLQKFLNGWLKRLADVYN